MNTNLKRALWGTLLAGGITLFGATVAQAAETTGDDGLLSGTQGLISVAVPVTVAGNGISVLGDATSTDAQTSSPSPSVSVGGGDASTSGSDGTGSGTQALVDVVLPVNLGGNAVSVLGDATTTSAATSQPTTAAAPTAEPSTTAAASSTGGADSILGGTQGVVDAAAPVTVGGNAVSVLGDAESTNAATAAPADTSGTASSGGATTDGTDGILGGTQLGLPVSAPITLGGNAIAVAGDATTTQPATGGTTTPGTTVPGTTTPGTTTPGTTTPGTTTPTTTNPVAGGSSVTGMVAASGPVRTLASTGGMFDMLPLLAGLAALTLGVMLTARRHSRTE
ncbi:hypothetical protein HMPREF1529_00905 [Microbacterium sp. oral taxon 186 str. F0373]|uniref:hypothetical protein n=1 Tax=Microbacterium sp. oral taxon 186 TaxID=712383 RepID=UPI00034E6279|nr:hypothetical protein [Microbacterium sp. oral taxon 186]EPD85890.1 hypothetical protein HMPREF1529_00905 [Microbacterium sp. oral taxon 186 str. F0373]